MDTILSSTTRLVANRDAWEDEWRRRKIEDLALLLQGALEARSKVGLKMNLHKSRLESVRPAARRPGRLCVLSTLSCAVGCGVGARHSAGGVEVA